MVPTCYFELRKQSVRGSDSIAADMMRHLHTRQHLGKAVICCQQPAALLSASRKQWLKLSRIIQNKRAATLNADKILKYTHTITRMQQMRFSAKDPLQEPDADIYFLQPHMLETIPLHCLTIYLTTNLSDAQAKGMIGQVFPEALIVDYDRSTDWQGHGLASKKTLEDHVITSWQTIRHFLQEQQIDDSLITQGAYASIATMDDALDTLLGVSRHFLRLADDFQHSLELARPLRIDSDVRKEYDTVILLAHRVQALSPGSFTQHFLESYNEDDTFFFYDRAKQYILTYGEPITETIKRHTDAGRYNLARAIRLAYSVQPRRLQSLQASQTRYGTPVYFLPN